MSLKILDKEARLLKNSFNGGIYDGEKDIINSCIYCSSFIHYRVYRMMVGDPDYKAFLYDEYKSTWKGYERASASSSWTLKYN